MADPFISEIRIVGFTFAPRGWYFCNGDTIPIMQDQALFAQIGVTYGGDGRSTFQLPNLAETAPMHSGQGPGLSPRLQGGHYGSSTAYILEQAMPQHSHTVEAINEATANSTQPQNHRPGKGVSTTQRGRTTTTEIYAQPGTLVPMAVQAVEVTGSGQVHENRQPYLAMNFIICSDGVWPPRS